MKIISDDLASSLKNIINETQRSKDGMKSCPYVNVENINFIKDYKYPDRLLEVLSIIEDNYKKLHNGDRNNVAFYMFKCIELLRNHSELVEFLSSNSLATLASEAPIELDDTNRLKVIADDDVLTVTRILYPRMLPGDFLATYLNNYDRYRKRHKDTSNFKNLEFEKLEASFRNYFIDGITKESYINKILNEKNVIKYESR